MVMMLNGDVEIPVASALFTFIWKENVFGYECVDKTQPKTGKSFVDGINDD